MQPRCHFSDRLTSTLLSFPLIFLTLSLGAEAQVQNGVITGTVSDPSEAVVAGAAVTVKNIATASRSGLKPTKLAVQCQRNEHWRLLGTCGSLRLQTAEATDLVLNAGTVLRVDFKLQVGAPTEAVEVTGAAAPINTENARLSTTVDSTQIANLPLNGRNVYDLIQYAPGATNVRGVIFESGANTVVNGVRENRDERMAQQSLGIFSQRRAGCESIFRESLS